MYENTIKAFRAMLVQLQDELQTIRRGVSDPRTFFIIDSLIRFINSAGLLGIMRIFESPDRKGELHKKSLMNILLINSAINRTTPINGITVYQHLEGALRESFADHPIGGCIAQILNPFLPGITKWEKQAILPPILVGNGWAAILPERVKHHFAEVKTRKSIDDLYRYIYDLPLNDSYALLQTAIRTLENFKAVIMGSFSDGPHVWSGGWRANPIIKEYTRGPDKFIALIQSIKSSLEQLYLDPLRDEHMPIMKNTVPIFRKLIRSVSDGFARIEGLSAQGIACRSSLLELLRSDEIEEILNLFSGVNVYEILWKRGQALVEILFTVLQRTFQPIHQQIMNLVTTCPAGYRPIIRPRLIGDNVGHGHTPYVVVEPSMQYATEMMGRLGITLPDVYLLLSALNAILTEQARAQLALGVSQDLGSGKDVRINRYLGRRVDQREILTLINGYLEPLMTMLVDPLGLGEDHRTTDERFFNARPPHPLIFTATFAAVAQIRETLVNDLRGIQLEGRGLVFRDRLVKFFSSDAVVGIIRLLQNNRLDSVILQPHLSQQLKEYLISAIRILPEYNFLINLFILKIVDVHVPIGYHSFVKHVIFSNPDFQRQEQEIENITTEQILGRLGLEPIDGYRILSLIYTALNRSHEALANALFGNLANIRDLHNVFVDRYLVYPNNVGEMAVRLLSVLNPLQELVHNPLRGEKWPIFSNTMRVIGDILDYFHEGIIGGKGFYCTRHWIQHGLLEFCNVRSTGAASISGLLEYVRSQDIYHILWLNIEAFFPRLLGVIQHCFKAPEDQQIILPLLARIIIGIVPIESQVLLKDKILQGLIVTPKQYAHILEQDLRDILLSDHGLSLTKMDTLRLLEIVRNGLAHFQPNLIEALQNDISANHNRLSAYLVTRHIDLNEWFTHNVIERLDNSRGWAGSLLSVYDTLCVVQ